MNSIYSDLNEYNEQLKFYAVGEGKTEIINSIVKLLN